MKFSFWICGLSVFLVMPLGGCGSSTTGTDASNANLAANGIPSNEIASSSVPGAQPTLVLPPEAPPMLLPDIPPPVLPAPPRTEPEPGAYGRYVTTVVNAFRTEWVAYADSYDKTHAAALKVDNTEVHPPNLDEPIAALHAAQSALEENDAHAKRLGRYMAALKPQVDEMYVGSNYYSSLQHLQKGVAQTEAYMAEISSFIVDLRDMCHKMRDALSRGDTATYHQLVEQSKQDRKKTGTEPGVDEFILALEDYQKGAANS